MLEFILGAGVGFMAGFFFVLWGVGKGLWR